MNRNDKFLTPSSTRWPFPLPVTWDASMAAASVAAQTPQGVRSRIFSVWFDHHLFGVSIGGGKINNRPLPYAAAAD